MREERQRRNPFYVQILNGGGAAEKNPFYAQILNEGGSAEKEPFICSDLE